MTQQTEKATALQGHGFQNIPKQNENVFDDSTKALRPQHQSNNRIEYITAMVPGAHPATLDSRIKARQWHDVAMKRIGDWSSWSPCFHALHFMAAQWTGRAAISHWHLKDIDLAVEAGKLILQATAILQELEDQNGGA